MLPSVKFNYSTEFLKVKCDQGWEQMQPMEQGRFCHSCQKPVFDFTSWERNRIIEFYKDHPAACDMFKPEQLDTSLHPINFSFRIRIRHLLIPMLAFIGLPNLKAQVNLKARTNVEVLPDSSGKTKLKKKDIVLDASTGALIKKTDKTYVVNPPVSKELKDKKKKKYYWSKKFPFIHKRQHRWIGCPRFP